MRALLFGFVVVAMVAVGCSGDDDDAEQAERDMTVGGLRELRGLLRLTRRHWQALIVEAGS